MSKLSQYNKSQKENKDKVINFMGGISYKVNPFYLISEATAYHWVGAGGYIIMLYEPVSRIVLFTFDYS